MAPKPKKGKAKAKGKAVAAAAAGPPQPQPPGAAAAAPAGPVDSFNASHFSLIRACKAEIFAHPVFIGVQGMQPLGIQADAAETGRQVPMYCALS